VGLVVASEPTSAEKRGPGPRDTWPARAHHDSEMRSGATGYRAAHGCTPWHHVNARFAPYLVLKLVCRGTRSVRYRQWAPGPPREKQ
jgi:hypothetical protein